ncbi:MULTISPECIES: hypothetical protein [unclassified Novosphingobium]|uniref:hypothetical protein n=1 Tax=unclassified Novosphingobium TaxID=2644732 RepID=UPI00149464FA|nr:MULTISPECIES: hypothetical protein [unclassified Novosphingobium]MBB3357988.1 hypothetical protein [Novosphingobium sp. BK256]MBB3374349.1 hypothetical protein [Novosphingobium sp. BK280]MBB3378761.1 hypothetical protein [Novosphingobium sp. BK258]MBB3420455.1 hypothetical protein [Novosphingobium sp. BK267]MBB3448423.1 hypothetical protein [Novosphingobium sp. BK352]
MLPANIGLQDRVYRYTLTLFVRNLCNQNDYSSMVHTRLMASATNPSDLTAFVNKDANRYVGATFGAKF